MPNRSDIRPDTSNGSIQEGIPLRLVLHVYDVEDEDGDRVGSCTPLRRKSRHLACQFTGCLFWCPGCSDWTKQFPPWIPNDR